MNTILLLAHEALAGALFYSCFCRAIAMDDESTSHGVLFAFWLLGISSVVMIAAPLISVWHPNIPTLVLMAAIVVTQFVTSRYWRRGVPRQFRVDYHDTEIGH